MTQNAEAIAFLDRVAQLPPGPGANLDVILKPSLDDEAELRKLFAQDKANARLQDPHVGLVDVFDAPATIRTTRARVVATEQDLDAQYIMPLSEEQRRAEGSPSMVQSLADFKTNWAVFTEGSLSQLLDWNNIIAAGGAVQACLTPLPEKAKVSKRAIRKHYHSHAYPASDVDLFLYGLTPEQAEVKINAIYEAVRDSIPWDVTCIRTKHTVSIHSQYPYRAVQIVLRLYQSPAEVLAGFDVDAPCCAYDGARVWANPRAIVAMMRQCNTTDITRRSPSYEVRLAKYAWRCFEIYVPQLKRDNVDPTIFERSIARVQGLARLLVLEKLVDASAREAYVESRRAIRGRPQKWNSWDRRTKDKKYKGDLKGEENAGIEMSDYDVLSLHIPYGPGWDARRIDKLVYQTDLGMNSPYNPKNKGRRLHRHPAFFGTMPECLEDCCEHCVEPKRDEERALQEEEDKSYVRGRVQFIVEDPGRQSMSGSFNPIDEGEWTEQAYMGRTEKFFAAIASHDRGTVASLIEQGLDVNRRDHVGRTPLQVAIMCKALDIAFDLVDANARMTSRLVDGRTALHLAAQLDLPTVVKKLLERSSVNAEAAKAAEDEAIRLKEGKAVEQSMETEEDHESDEDSEMRDSSEDDWSSDEGTDSDDKKDKEQKGDDSGIPEENEEEPDVFEIDVQDWDYGFSPLHYAVVSGSSRALDFLISAGANVKLVAKMTHNRMNYLAHPLLLTAITENEDTACDIAERLLAAGAVSSEATDDLFTIFHRMVCLSKPKLVATLLRRDPSAKAVLDIPYMPTYTSIIFPIVSAIRSRSYSVLAVLLAHGAKLVITKDDFERARDLKIRNHQMARGDGAFPGEVPSPLESAVAHVDEVVHLLVALGADVNECIGLSAFGDRSTYVDYVRLVLKKIFEFKTPPLISPEPADITADSDTLLPEIPAWKAALQKIIAACDEVSAAQVSTNRTKTYVDEIKTYFDDVEKLLATEGGKSGQELYTFTDIERDDRRRNHERYIRDIPTATKYYYRVFGNADLKFFRHTKAASQAGMTSTLVALYEELYTACYTGDNLRIQQLCMPQGAHKIADTPLQISVHWGTQWQGFTPIHLAILARKWDTLKLILAIATAQYSPSEPVEPKFESRAVKLSDGDSDDGDSEDEDSGEDDGMDYEEEAVNFVDIAKRASDIRVPVAPNYMLAISAPFLNVRPDGRTNEVFDPIVQAIVQDDFEAFMQILSITDSLPVNMPKQSLLPNLLLRDRPAMLDEYIRRTGEGINIDQALQISDGQPVQVTSRKEYLGLNVHGKKRKDLAKRGDPDAPAASSREFPILWTAVARNLTATVRYLASDQPLAAYRFYASSHGDKQAKLLRKVPDLAASLPALLGWTVNDANETALTVAIINNHLELLEMLFKMRPNDMRSYLHLRHRVHGFNNILLAAKFSTKPALLDFLLAEGVSPVESDTEGRNIFHVICSQDSDANLELLKHVLHHIPQDMIGGLLRQQCKNTGDTPLHVAIKGGVLRYVHLLVQVEAQQYLIRDSYGSIPLHAAVYEQDATITQLIGEAGPSEALTLEDGVGNTPLETATLLAFRDKLQPICNARIGAHKRLMPEWNVSPTDLAQLQAELPRYTSIIEILLAEGRLTKGTKLVKELAGFAERIAGRIAAAEARKIPEKSQNSQDYKLDAATSRLPRASATLSVLVKIIQARAGLRRLVHLSDVHRSVQAGLDKYKKCNAEEDKDDDDEETEPSSFSTLCTHYPSGLFSNPRF